MLDYRTYAPAAILAAGIGLMFTVEAQRSLPLRQSLDELSNPVPGSAQTDFAIDAEQVQVAGMTSYINRWYENDTAALGLYVGYYDSQSQGKTVHSPKNCLPGGGWEPVSAGYRDVVLPGGGTVTVNRYLIAKDGEQALAYYWYQGRGRVASNEYLVKFDLLRDAALRRRTDEALVRIIIPVYGEDGLAAADALAQRTAASVIPELRGFLPA